jgi:hypothetical protein
MVELTHRNADHADLAKTIEAEAAESASVSRF